MKQFLASFILAFALFSKSEQAATPDPLGKLSMNCVQAIGDPKYIACLSDFTNISNSIINDIDPNNLDLSTRKMAKTLCCGIMDYEMCIENSVKGKCTDDEIKILKDMQEKNQGFKPGQVIKDPTDPNGSIDCTPYPMDSKHCTDKNYLGGKGGANPSQVVASLFMACLLVILALF